MTSSKEVTSQSARDTRGVGNGRRAAARREVAVPGAQVEPIAVRSKAPSGSFTKRSGAASKPAQAESLARASAVALAPEPSPSQARVPAPARTRTRARALQPVPAAALAAGAAHAETCAAAPAAQPLEAAGKQRRKPAASRRRNLSPEVLEATAAYVFEGMIAGVKKLAISRGSKEQTGFHLSRQAVDSVWVQSLDEGYLQFRPPVSLQLQGRVKDWVRGTQMAEGLHDTAPDIHVVSAKGRTSGMHCARLAAHNSLERILKIADERRVRELDPTVHLALGAGGMTVVYAEILGQLFAGTSELPRLVVHSLASSYLPTRPLENPLIAYKHLHDGYAYSQPDAATRIQFVGLACEPSVEARGYEQYKRRASVKNSFECRKKIDILVTSLSTFTDPHSYVNEYSRADADPVTVQALAAACCIGDIQLRPISATGPIRLKTGRKPVVLFEIDELVAFARTPGKHSILMIAPCGRDDCKETRAQMAQAVLGQKALRVWNHVYVAHETAEALMRNLVHEAAVA